MSEQQYECHIVEVQLMCPPGLMTGAEAHAWVQEAMRYYFGASMGKFKEVHLRSVRTEYSGPSITEAAPPQRIRRTRRV